MESGAMSKLLLVVLVILCIGTGWQIFFGQSKLREADKKIDTIQQDLKKIRGNLDKSVAEIDHMVQKLNYSEASLNAIRKQVEIIDVEYQLFKEKSGKKIDSLRNVSREYDRELKEMQDYLKDLE